MGRNTALLKEIVTTLDTELDDPEYALDQLESHFHDALLVNAGNVFTIVAAIRRTSSGLNITAKRSVPVVLD